MIPYQGFGGVGGGAFHPPPEISFAPSEISLPPPPEISFVPPPLKTVYQLYLFRFD